MADHAVLRIRTIFFLHALGSGGIYSRIPDIQQAMGLDEATLGFDFLGFSLGAILVFLLASPVVERGGTRVVMLWGIPALAGGTALLAVMPNAAALFVAFLAYGAVYGLTNIAMNIEADRIEAAAGRRVMNSCHGLWSLGYLLAALVGTLAAGTGVSAAMHLSLIVPPVAVLAVFAAADMGEAPPRPHAGTLGRRFGLPTAAVMLLVLFVVGPAMLEGALRNWSVIYMRDSFAAPEWVDTLTLPAFLAAQAVGRMRGDSLVTRYGVVPSVRVLMAVALAGLLAVALAPSFWVALLGFLLIGAGLCIYYPLATSAAAQLGDRPASQNVAAMTMSTQIMLLGAPALLGLVADAAGTRTVFVVLLPALLVAIWLARYLSPRKALAATA